MTTAVRAGDIKDEEINDTVVTTEKDEENEIRSTISFSKRLPKGEYKVDIYLNGNLERTLMFTIM